MSLTKKNLEDGQSLLETVVSNHFFRKHTARDLPTFDRSEVGTGKELGVGGFCVVSEIQQLRLDPEKGVDQNSGSGLTPSPEADQPQNAVKDSLDSSLSSDDDDDGGGGGNTSDTDYLKSIRDDYDDVDLTDALGYVDQHDHHYHLSPDAARHFMAEHSLRDGDPRYAIKKLRSDLGEKEKLRGVKDLAIEAKFLAVISHPNIIKMRGMAGTDSLRYDFFIVLDRLYGTLEERIDDWAETYKNFSPCCGIFGGDKAELKSLLLEKLTAMYDISKAICYLHENNIIYRDIKPDNCGFDIRGDIKLFDFGLAKVLQKKDKTKDGTYKLTGLTGSRRYMAPEVAKNKPYNLTADSFSFGTLLWQVMALEVPFESFTPGDYMRQVCEMGYRPSIPTSWPVFLRELLKDCWKEQLTERPDFIRICNTLRGEMTNIADSSRGSIHQRTTHMMNRSQRSHRNLMRSLPAETETKMSAHGTDEEEEEDKQIKQQDGSEN